MSTDFKTATLREVTYYKNIIPIYREEFELPLCVNCFKNFL